MELIREIKPTQCTLVPDSDNQLTSDHGFDLITDRYRLAPVIEELKSLGIRTSLFMDPEPRQIEIAAEIGANRIELYTESFARAFPNRNLVNSIFKNYQIAAEVASECGLGINAGHDLNLENLTVFCKLKNLLEVSIGHHLTVDALEMGLKNATKAYKKALST